MDQVSAPKLCPVVVSNKTSGACCRWWFSSAARPEFRQVRPNQSGRLSCSCSHQGIGCQACSHGGWPGRCAHSSKYCVNARCAVRGRVSGLAHVGWLGQAKRTGGVMHTGWAVRGRARMLTHKNRCVPPGLCSLWSRLRVSSVVEGKRVGAYLARIALRMSRGWLTGVS